jgi:HAMP domain-containing protein
VPVLLLGIGWTLVQWAGWSHAAAFAATGVAALVLAAVLAWLAWRRLKTAIGKLSRSRDEFASNVKWIKDALKQNHSPSRHSRRSRPTSDEVSQERTALR